MRVLHNVIRKQGPVNYALGMVHFTNGRLTHFARLLTLVQCGWILEHLQAGGFCEAHCFRYFYYDLLSVFR